MRSTRALAVAVVLSIGTLVWAAGPAVADTKPLEREVSEAMKTVSVKIRLIDKLGVDALGISVSVTGDRAILSGAVSTPASRRLAEEVALSVDGIRGVRNEVVEKTPANAVGATEAAVRNASLELKVKAVLLEEIGANALKVEVEAADGVVSLRGKPNDPETARVAVRKVRELKGVKKVVDLLG
jgi:osmotically-inducible protein OsmY